MKNGSAASTHEDACARVAARFDERWLRIYAGRKLRSDPIFLAAFGLFRDSPEPILDLGCGVGLLAFYLRERNFQPSISGLDTDGRKIKRARTVAHGVYRDLQFVEQDASKAIVVSGNVVLFDILHYLPPEEQESLLERLAARVAPGAMVVIRDCPRDGNARSWLTYLAERFAQTSTWNIGTALHFPTRERIFAAFSEDEFSRRIEPLWGRSPFNNHLFIFRRHPAATVAAEAGRSRSQRSLGQRAFAPDSAGENPGRS